MHASIGLRLSGEAVHALATKAAQGPSTDPRADLKSKQRWFYIAWGWQRRCWRHGRPLAEPSPLNLRKTKDS